MKISNTFNADKKDTENERMQILALFIACIPGLTEGLLYSWSSPFIVKITKDKVNYNISEDEASYFPTIQPIATILFMPIFSWLADKIGRKKTHMLTAVPHIITWILAAVAKDANLFYLSMFFAGIGHGGFYAVLPLYVGEIVNPNVRGTWGNLLSISVYLGELIINIVGSYFSVKETSYIFLPLSVLFLICFSFMPESPYWYLMKGKDEKAKQSLRFFKQKHNVDTDFSDLKLDVQRQLSETGTWMDLIKIKSNRKALIAGLFIRGVQHTAGLGIFMYYGQLIFEKSGSSISHEAFSILYFSLYVVLNIIVVMFIFSHFARRTLIFISVTGSGVMLYILATYFYIYGNTDVNLSSFKWMPIATTVIYQIFMSVGLGVIPTLMMSELYSASIKAKAMLVLTVAISLQSIFMNFLFTFMVNTLGFHSPFYFFAICNTIAVVICYYIIPETRGKTLEEIQQMLKK